MATVAGKIVMTGRQNNNQRIFNWKKAVTNSSILNNCFIFSPCFLILKIKIEHPVIE
jgi:hypothetical protein